MIWKGDDSAPLLRRWVWHQSLANQRFPLDLVIRLAQDADPRPHFWIFVGTTGTEVTPFLSDLQSC